MGDGHAARRSGEVRETATECLMERVELTFGLRRDVSLRVPRALTDARRPDTGWLNFGFHRDLEEAMFIAVDGMLDLMGELLGLDGHRALALASVTVDLRLTQVVNESQGVRALLPHGAIR